MMASVATARHVCVELLALGLVITLAGCGGSRLDAPSSAARSTTAARPPHTPNPYATPIIRHVEHRQLAAFPLLRAPSEGLPIATQRILRKHAFGINWNLARRIPTKLEGSYWLVPGNGYLCVISQGVMHGRGVGTTCAQTAEAVAHGIADISIALPGTPHRARLIVGVAPTRAREVLVHTQGKVSVAAVHQGVFVLRDSILSSPDTMALR
jgi:hypothetical protein